MLLFYSNVGLFKNFAHWNLAWDENANQERDIFAKDLKGMHIYLNIEPCQRFY